MTKKQLAKVAEPGERLSEARRLSKLTCTELAQRAGVHPDHVAAAERGDWLSLLEWVRLAEVLRCRLDWLLGRCAHRRRKNGFSEVPSL